MSLSSSSGFTLAQTDLLGGSVLGAATSRDLRERKFNALIEEYNALIPKDIHTAFRYLRTMAITSEIVAPAVAKIAESAITDLHVEGAESEQVRQTYLSDLRMRDLLLGISFDMSVFWNAFAMFYLAPTRVLKCPRCLGEDPNHAGFKPIGVKKMKLDIDKMVIKGECPKCKKDVIFKRDDKFYLSKNKIRLIRVSPFNIRIDHFPLLGRNVYYYKMSEFERSRIIAGDPEYINDLPWTFVEAAAKKLDIRLNADNIYHFSPGGFSGVYPGWTPPRGLAAMRSLMYLHSLLTSNEVVADGKINDLTLIYPQMSAAGDNPLSAMGGNDFQSNMKTILTNYKYDKNTIGFTPGPIGVESVFGQGRAQLLSAEIDQVVRSILGVWGISKEVLYSGTTYASMVVAVKLLASELATKRTLFNRFLANFVQPKMKPFGLGQYEAKLTPFESADDIQRTQMMLQSKGQGAPIPWASVMKRLGVDYNEAVKQTVTEEKEMKILYILQQKNIAESQGEAQVVMQKYQSKAQRMMQATMGMPEDPNEEMEMAANGIDQPAQSQEGDGENYDPRVLGLQIGMDLMQRFGGDRPSIDEQLMILNDQNPEVASYAKEVIDTYIPAAAPAQPDQAQGAPQAGGEGPVDMSPEPEVLPSRKGQ